MMRDLWIIAAGRGTRMGDTTVPKALVKIDGKSNLRNTLDLVRNKFRKVFVVVAKEMEEVVLLTLNDWYPLISDFNVEVVSIQSGGGDGKAVLEAYHKVMPFHVTPQAVILWGDAHLRSGDIVDELLHALDEDPDATLIIPTALEKMPYVAINTTLVGQDRLALSADFTKYGEVHVEGLHDQSIFGVAWDAVIPSLQSMKLVSYKEDEVGGVKFTTQSGELTFLNVVHYLWNIGCAARVYETKFPLMGYNTHEEVEKIMQSITKGKTS